MTVVMHCLATAAVIQSARTVFLEKVEEVGFRDCKLQGIATCGWAELGFRVCKLNYGS